MKDSYGRTIDYLRISITDRCNLRCKYCMPTGIPWTDPGDILTFEEIRAAALAGARLGIRHIKVTGGEPFARLGCCSLIRMLKEIPGIEKVTVTTNGILLRRFLDPLLKAGIDGINISLDTLDRERYRDITGTDGLSEVLLGIKEAVSGKVPVKINAVSVDWDREYGNFCRPDEGGKEEEEAWWVPVAMLAEQLPVDVRFIEMMPIGYGRDFQALSQQELLGKMKERFPGMERDERIHGFGPAVYYKVPGFQGSIGFISAIHGKFCGGCNRIRLTSKGYLKTCLCFEDGVDLKEIMRAGQESRGEDRMANGHFRRGAPNELENESMQERLAEAIREAVKKKPGAHCFEQPEKITEAQNMIAIGG